tara:strand:- start:55 stop:327 length:273 start_codon:yes stop_codon:yes gene_type:complete
MTGVPEVDFLLKLIQLGPLPFAVYIAWKYGPSILKHIEGFKAFAEQATRILDRLEALETDVAKIKETKPNGAIEKDDRHTKNAATVRNAT